MNSSSIVRKIFLLLFVGVALATSTGCVQRIGDFTLLTTKNINVDDTTKLHRVDTRVQGKDSTFMIFFFPITIANMKEATDRAIESVPGAVALEDAVVTTGFWFVPPFFAEEYYVVEGTPLIDPKRTPMARFGVAPKRDGWD